VKKVKKTKFSATCFLALLLLATATPLITTRPANAEDTEEPATLTTDGNWTYIQNSLITIVFPAGAKKPMFLWWHTNDPNNINVVKFKGLMEYTTYEKPYFLWRCQAEPWRIKQYIRDQYYEPWNRGHHHDEGLERGKIEDKLEKIANALDVHASYLPFSSSKWRLDGPENVTRGNVKYPSFNFTLVDVPGNREHFQFAEGNVIIRCRFYYTPATENAHGVYNYTVNAGELKIDLVIKHWEWNIDKLEPILDGLRELGFDIPKGKTSLALWVNLASINMTKLEIAEDETESLEDVDHTEAASMAKDMYIEDERISVVENETERDAMPMQNRWQQRFQVCFEKGNTTFAGFFKFVPQAIITDGTTYNTTEVTASYIQAGAHLRLFIGHPYFGNYTLEHDPSLGVESVSLWLPTSILAVLVGATIIVAVALIAIKILKKTVNIVSIQ
jgi:hypothetical protein